MPTKMRSTKRHLTDVIEDEASIVAKNLEERVQDLGIPASIERQIALTLEQLHRSRATMASIKTQLLRLECYIGTDLLQLQPRPHASVDHYRDQRLSLKERLLDIEKERRKLVQNEVEQESVLHEKLLYLLTRLKLLQDSKWTS